MLKPRLLPKHSHATGEQLVTRLRLHEDLSPMKAELLLLKWMVGFNLAATITILFLQLKH